MKALKATRPEKIVPLGEYLSFLTNGHTPLHHDLSEGEVPFLTAEHVFDFRVTYDSDKRIERIHHEGELKRTQLREGDFLITIKGRIGNAAVVEDIPVPTNINQDVALLRLKDGLPPYYLLAYLNSIVGKAFSEQYCTGQINPFLGLGNLRLLPIPIYDHQRMTDLADETAKVIGEARKAGEESKGLLAGAKMIVEQAVGGVGKRLHYRNGES
jgi:type I restriction enzyme S subunit